MRGWFTSTVRRIQNRSLMSTEKLDPSMDPNRPQKFSVAAIGLGIGSLVFGVAYGLGYWDATPSDKSDDRRNDKRPANK
jgi:hypothetical protein